MSDASAATRRDFLKLGAAAAPAVAATVVAATPGEAAAADAPGEGLRRTAHVEKAYETARF